MNKRTRTKVYASHLQQARCNISGHTAAILVSLAQSHQPRTASIRPAHSLMQHAGAQRRPPERPSKQSIDHLAYMTHLLYGSHFLVKAMKMPQFLFLSYRAKQMIFMISRTALLTDCNFSSNSHSKSALLYTLRYTQNVGYF